MTRAAPTLIVLLLAALAVALWTVGGGSAGLVYLLIYALAVLPGLPLGFKLFGRDQPAGWIAGAAMGYALTVVALWVAIVTQAASASAFLVVVLAAGAVTWAAAARMRGPAVALPRWTPASTTSLAVVLLVTIVLAAPPLARVGMLDPQGNKRYRAYFTADFVWHTALSAELTRFSLPPRNPYLASRPMHYYWGYFLVPAAIAETGPASLRDVERCLKLNAMLTGLLLMASVFIATWAAVAAPVPAAAGTLLALCASSLEGLYALWRIWSRHAPLDAVRDLNVDALTAWDFHGHRIDGLQRCLWYVPQHAMSYALGLIAIAAAVAIGSDASLAGILLVGIALAGSTLFNPFVGGVFALVWGTAVSIDAVRRHQDPWRRIWRHTAAIAPVGLAIAWCMANRMVEGAGGALEIGFNDTSRQSPVTTMVLSFGPVLAAAVAGLAVGGAIPRARVTAATLLAGIALFLLYFVWLDVDHEWVPFRAGQMLLAAFAVLAGRGFAASRARIGRLGLVTAGLLLFAAGAPTTIIDAYNAGDIDNLRAGPSFQWTLVLSREQQAAFDWIRRETPRQAIVQMEPIVRERDSWSLIPSFAQRHMAAGLPISLLRIPDYRARSENVKALFASSDPSEAARIAHALHIRYLYVDATDRAAYPGVAKFDGSAQYFEPVFREGPVGVYQVR